MRRNIPEKRIHALAALFALSLIAIVAGCSTGSDQVQAKHPGQFSPESERADFVRMDFAERRTNLIRAVLMPPDLEVTRATFWRTKSLHTNEADAIAGELTQLVAAHLQQQGFVIVTPQAATNEPVSNESAHEHAEAFVHLKEWMTIAPWGASIFSVDTNEDTGLGSSAKILAEDAKADVLVCVKFWSVQTTFARRARSFHATAAGCVGAVVGAGAAGAAIYYAAKENGLDGADGLGLLLLIPAGAAAGFIAFREVGWWITGGGIYDESFPNRAGVQVAIVEASTGKVLWANTETVGSYRKNLDSLIARLFLNFPQ